MASSSDHSVTESIRNDFLTCHICFEVFTDPRILPCLHSYCRQCICTYVDTAKTDGRPVVCPECREPILNDVGSLKTNFFINGLTEVVKVKADKRLNCTTCQFRGTDSTAVEKCLDCGDYLCSTCSDGHNASSLTWKHEKIPLYDIKQGMYDEKLRQLQKIKCLKHDDKDVEYYCESCSLPVCLTCVLITHRDHKCQTVTDAITQRKASIISLTDSIRQNLSKLEKQESRVKSTLDYTKRKCTDDISTIEEKVKQDISRLIAEKASEIQTVREKSMQIEKKQESELEEVLLQKGVTGSCLNFCDNILEKGRDEEILMLEKLITERLGQLQGQAEETGTKPIVHNKQDSVSAGEKETKEMDICASVELTNEEKDDKTNDAKESDSMTELLGKFKDAYGAITTSQAYETQKLVLKMSKIFMCQHESDTTSPDIKGIAFNPQIGIVLSDKANRKIKIYTTEGVLKKIFTKDNFTPFAVAIAGNMIGAISENNLHLFKQNGKEVNKILIHSRKPNSSLQFTYALTATEEEFMVGNIPGEYRIRVYSLDGTLKKLITCRVEFPLRSLSIAPSGHIAMCEWGGASVKVMSSEGNVKIRCRRALLWKPNDACVSKDEHIFVADYELGDICVFDKSGKIVLEHSTFPDGVKPVGVVFDDQERLFVAGKIGYVSVYDFGNYV